MTRKISIQEGIEFSTGSYVGKIPKKSLQNLLRWKDREKNKFLRV